jgi:menaquinone-dependent protoporphyrinogen oxidase
VNATRVLVAFASRSGTTAGVAEAVAAVLRQAGLDVDCVPAGEVVTITAYGAIVLGSGVFVARRATDGGGFLERNRAQLDGRSIWLFTAGPIGAGHPAEQDCESGECSLQAVARAVGARGAARFAVPGPATGGNPVERLAPVDLALVRGWAGEIAAALVPSEVHPDRPASTRRRRCARVGVAR